MGRNQKQRQGSSSPLLALSRFRRPPEWSGTTAAGFIKGLFEAWALPSARTPQILEDLARGVAAIDAANPTTGMSAGATHEEILDRRPVIGIAGNRPPRKELVQRQVAVHDVAAHESVFLLHVIRPEDLSVLDRTRQVVRETFVAGDHSVGVRLQLVAMRCLRPACRDVLREAAHDVVAGGGPGILNEWRQR